MSSVDIRIYKLINIVQKMSRFSDNGKAALPYNNTIAPDEDTTPAMMLGLQALAGTVWWIVTFFVYVGTNATD